MFSLIIYILIAAVGFMMGFIYKKSFTTAEFFNPRPANALRNFMVVFLLAMFITYGLSWWTLHTLSSTTIPDESSMQYQNSKSVMLFMLNLFFFLLMVFCNLYSQALKKIAWVPYLLTFAFYAVFILKDAYFISSYFAVWQKSLQLLKGDLPEFTNLAWTKTGLGFLVTAFNAGMIWWGLRK